jgi:hypothetical protein
MAVDLEELVEPLRRALNPPGEDLFPGATTEEWVGRLSDAFWRARLAGFYPRHRATEDTVLPLTGGKDLTRAEQEVIVQYARVRALQNKLINMPTAVRSKAGPVSSEVERSAQLLVALLKEATDDLAAVAEEVAARAPARAAFIDGVVASTAHMVGGGWVR